MLVGRLECVESWLAIKNFNPPPPFSRLGIQVSGNYWVVGIRLIVGVLDVSGVIFLVFPEL